MARAAGHETATDPVPGAPPEVFYPAFIDLTGRCCLVVGGGPVGTEKTEKLLDAGADVRLVSPQVTPHLAGLVASGVHPSLPEHLSDLMERKEQFSRLPNSASDIERHIRQNARVVRGAAA